MTRMTPFASPLMLGFDAMEKTLERIAKGNDGYPPYNIERLRPNGDTGAPERLRGGPALRALDGGRHARATPAHHLRAPAASSRGDEARAM